MESDVARIQDIQTLSQPFPVATATPKSQKRQHQVKEHGTSGARPCPQTTPGLLLMCPEQGRTTRSLWPVAFGGDSRPPTKPSNRKGQTFPLSCLTTTTNRRKEPSGVPGQTGLISNSTGRMLSSDMALNVPPSGFSAAQLLLRNQSWG